MRTPARLLAAVLACTVIAIACANDAGERVEPALETPVNQPLAAGQGQSCGGSVSCATGLFCSRGVCCDTPCQQACWSCVASTKQSGTNTGVCGPSKAGSPPLGDCYAHNLGPDPECQAPTCNGTGACAIPANEPCGTTTCFDDHLILHSCSPSGQCEDSGLIGCGKYSCSGTACFTNCLPNDDSKCAPGHFCRAGACVEPQPDGTECSEDWKCAHGHCVDGFCCNAACDGKCESCDGDYNVNGKDGFCGAVKNDYDPDGDCDAEAPCGLNGSCDGSLHCALWPASQKCGDATCTPAAAPKGTSSIEGFLCNGAGTCAGDGGPQPCTGYSFCSSDGKSCPTSCTTSDDCSTDYSCYDLDPGDDVHVKQCNEALQPGQPCSAAEQCASGNCVDHHCCSVPCAGVCENCTTGECLPTTGDPIGLFSGGEPKKCSEPNPEEPCLTRECDGSSTTTCEGWVGAETSCTPGACEGGKKTLAAVCDGASHCADPKTLSCGGFACEGLDCKTSCSSDADCSSGVVCDLTGKCVSGSHCSGESALTDIAGTTTDCSPYRCQGGACLAICSSNEQCTSGYLCDRSTSTCVVTNQSTDVDAPGCWCEAPRTRATALGSWWMAAAIAVGLARRRSRHS